jgi:hypothetical protein
MVFDLQSVLPQLLAPAIAWAELQSRQVQQEGEVLSPASLVLAKRAGIKQPDLVRIKIVDQLPLPTEPLLRQAALQTGSLGPGRLGLRSATVFWLFADIWDQGFCRMNYDMYINMSFMAQLQGSCLSIWSK